MKEIKKYMVPGFTAGAAMAGIKKAGRLDMALIFSETPAVSAAVFTKNKVKAAPVLFDMLVAKKGPCPGCRREQRERERMHRGARDG